MAPYYPSPAGLLGNMQQPDNSLLGNIRDLGDPLLAIAGGFLSGNPGAGFAPAANIAAYQQAQRQRNLLDQRDFLFRVAEANRAQQNTENTFNLQKRQYEEAKTPFGFKKDERGNITIDPGFLEAEQKLAAAKQHLRTLTPTDLGKINEDAQRMLFSNQFLDTFKPEYGGYKIGGGVLLDAARRGIPVPGGFSEEGASWWQNYQKLKNDVRHGLFGAALTKQEIASFEGSDINPNMDPALIKKNLERQAEIFAGAAKRKANALIAEGYKPEIIYPAYGLDKNGNPPKQETPSGGATGEWGNLRIK